MNKETKLEKLRKTSKVFAVIAKVMEVLGYVFAALLLLIMILPTGLYFGFNLDDAGMIGGIWNLLQDKLDGEIALKVFFIILIILSMIFAYVMRKISKLFKNINSEYSPFVPENVRIIKTVAIGMAIITLIEVNIGSALVTGFVIWAIALLFNYGCELQNESDEII